MAKIQLSSSYPDYTDSYVVKYSYVDEDGITKRKTITCYANGKDKGVSVRKFCKRKFSNLKRFKIIRITYE